MLLTDVYEKFIDTCLKVYGLNPCHYFTSAGLGWDAMLKITGVKLETNIRHWQALIYWKRAKTRNLLHC